MAAKMAWLIITTLFCLTLTHTASEARHVPPTAVVVGTVYCDTCFTNDFSSKPTNFISGAFVAVECRDRKFRQEVKTNAQGKFRVELPFAVHKEINKIKRCSVKLLTSSDPYCAVASMATSSSLHLKSRNSKLGQHIYSAGYFTFKPSHQPTLCSQKPTTTTATGNNNSEQKDLSGFPALPSPGGDDEPTLPPPVNTNPNSPPEMNQNRLPPLPLLPRLPSLPPLPPLPRLPYLPPWPGKKSYNKHGKPTLRQGEQQQQQGDELSDQKSGRPGQPQGLLFPPILPPNPLQPSPPSLPLPPNPLQPPSLVPPVLPPNPFQPPPAPFLPIPPIPGLTPSPPPPALPFPFPPPLFPLPPGFPGIPPAAHEPQESESDPPSTDDP